MRCVDAVSDSSFADSFRHRALEVTQTPETDRAFGRTLLLVLPYIRGVRVLPACCRQNKGLRTQYSPVFCLSAKEIRKRGDTFQPKTLTRKERLTSHGVKLAECRLLGFSVAEAGNVQL